jgi:hypothetical protein
MALAITRSTPLLSNIQLFASMLLPFLGAAVQFVLLCLRPRLALTWLTRWFYWHHALLIVQRATSIPWHQRGIRLPWRRASHPGRPRIPVFTFDEVGAVVYQRLRGVHLRIGSMDLKVAAIVLSRDVNLLSRTFADFRQVTGLPVEDWIA